MEIVAIGDEHFVTGFELAGVRHTFVVDRTNASETFERIMENDDIGIVVMDNTTYDMLSERLKERAMTQVKPTVVVLSHDVSAEENLRLLIKRALGIDLWGKRGGDNE